MKFTTDRPCSDPERAARKIVEIAKATEPGQEGRIYIELINGLATEVMRRCKMS
jgi:hypothetical protein